MLPALLATFLFCLSAVTAHRATKIIGGIQANFWRLLFATALLGFWSHAWGQGLGGDAFAMFFWSGVIGFGIGDVALYQTLPRLGSRLTFLLVHCLAAPFAAVTEWWWLGTTLSLSQIGASFIILVGVAVALAPKEHLHIPTKVMVAGVGFGVLAALGQGLGASMSRVAYDINATTGFEVVGVNAAYQRILGGLLVGALSLLWLKCLPARSSNTTSEPANLKAPPRAWPWILGTGMAGPTLGVSCYQWALETTPSGLVLPVVATTPLMVIPLSLYMEGDRPGARSILGGIIAVAGVIALKLAGFEPN